MGTAAKCRICGEIVCYNNNTRPLGEHFLKKHPKDDIVYYPSEFKRRDARPGVDGKAQSISSEYCQESKQKKKMYKTTVETWRQGPAELTCPECGKIGRPLIRRQRNKVTRSSIGALCLIGCWPLCFLPFILGGTNLMNLYCKACGNFLGTYNRKKGCICPPTEKSNIVKVPNICDD